MAGLSNCMKSSLHHVLLACSLLTASASIATTLLAADPKPIFLYSRRFNAPGENRYMPDCNFKDVLQRLAKDNWEIFHRLTRWSAGLPAAP